MPSSALTNWPVGYEIPGNTSSDISFSWALQRLQLCDGSHGSCIINSSSPLPKRVLDLCDSQEQCVKLYESRGEVERYVCLSHCWGSRVLLRTLSANLESHRRGIPWDSLPLTYQDAIIFVRRLKIRYLWIDSLCIIQDDENDWRQEAARMASIYQGSYLTISATKSTDSNGGLFSEAPPKFKSYKLTHLDSNGQTQGIYARLHLTHQDPPIMSGAFLGKSPPLPFFKRGWILQERILSPRVLHFAPEELSWECLEETACECSGIITDPVGGISHFCTQPKLLHGFSHWSLLDDKKLERYWHALIEEYTALELAYDRDIFPAISGLAKEFGRVRKCPYFAGLWGKTILKDLLWYSKAGYTEAWPTRSERWRAPTWSWASLKGRINFAPPYDLLDTCEVLEVVCSPVGPDLTGELAEGFILLRGRLITSVLRYKSQTQATNLAHLYDLELLEGKMGNVHADYNSMVEGPGHIELPMTVYCLYIGEANKNSVKSFWFLLLRCIGESASDECQVFERVGLVEVFYAMEVNGNMTTVKIV